MRERTKSQEVLDDTAQTKLPEFYSQQDPRWINTYIQKGVRDFKSNFLALAEADKRKLVATILDSTAKDDAFLELTGIEEESGFLEPPFPQALVICPEVFESIQPYLQINKPEVSHHVLQLAELATARMVMDVLHYKDQSINLVSSVFLTPVMAWYVDWAYDNLEQAIENLKQVSLATKPEENVDFAVENLAILGVLHQKLHQDNPQAAQYRRILDPYITQESPRLIKDQFAWIEKQATKSERLQKLKGYWHQAFVTAWVAGERVEQRGKNVISDADRLLANQTLTGDVRSAETRQGVYKQAEIAYARTRQPGLHQQAQAEFDQQSLRLSQQSSEARKSLVEYSDQLLQLYNPNHQNLLDERGRAVKDWEFFQPKIGLLLNVFVQKAVSITNREMPNHEVEHVMAAVVPELVSVIEKPTANHQLSVTELFGETFWNLTSVEQVCLILFTALTLSSKNQRPHQAVHLISHRLHDVLQKTTDASPNALANSGQVKPFNLDYYQQLSQQAVERLSNLALDDEVLMPESNEFDEIITDRQQFMKTWIENFQKYGNKAETSRRWEVLSLQFRTIVLFFLTVNVGHHLYGSLDNSNFPDWTDFDLFSNVIWPVLMLALSTKKHYEDRFLPPFLKESRGVNPLEESAPEKYQEIKQKRNDKAHAQRMMLFKLAALALFFGLGQSFVRDMFPVIEDQLGSALNTELGQEGNQNGLPEGLSFRERVADMIDPEKLRDIKPRLEGFVYHMPESYGPDTGFRIGYIPEVLHDLYGREYKEPTDFYVFKSTIVEDMDDVSFDYTPNQVVYEPTHMNDVLHPLSGHQIVQIYQEGGTHPLQGTMGEMYFYGNLPERIVVVAERLPEVPLNSLPRHFREYEGVTGDRYNPWEDWTETRLNSLALNEVLNGDPALQALNLQYIQEADRLYEQFKNGELNQEELRAAWSNMGVRAAAEFSEYQDQHRTYSLLFRLPNGKWDTFSTVTAVANAPGQGYYCAIGNDTYQQFMATIGIKVVTRPGIPVHYYQDMLFSRIWHQDSITMLPNSRVLYTDMTPRNQNPGEDFSVMDWRNPTQEELDEMLGEPEMSLGAKRLIGLLSVLTAGVAGWEVQKRARKYLQPGSLEKELKKLISTDAQQADRVYAATAQLVGLVKSFANPELHDKVFGATYPDETFYQHTAHDMIGLLTAPAQRKLTTETSQKMEAKSSSSDWEAVRSALINVRRELKTSYYQKKRQLRAEEQQVLAEIGQLRAGLPEQTEDNQTDQLEENLQTKTVREQLKQSEAKLQENERQQHYLENYHSLRKIIRIFLMSGGSEDSNESEH